MSSDPNCRFSTAKAKERIVAEYRSVWAKADRYPVSKGHHLIILAIPVVAMIILA